MFVIMIIYNGDNILIYLNLLIWPLSIDKNKDYEPKSVIIIIVVHDARKT